MFREFAICYTCLDFYSAAYTPDLLHVYDLFATARDIFAQTCAYRHRARLFAAAYGHFALHSSIIIGRS